MKRFMCFIFGIIAQLTLITAPVHEFGHWLMAELMGIQATMAWSKTTYYGRITKPQYFVLAWSGVGFETLIFTLFAVIAHPGFTL